MAKTLFLFAFLIVLGCCKKPEPGPMNEPEIPKSQIFISADNEVLFDTSYTSCGKFAPTPSESIGDVPRLLVSSPGVFYPYDPANLPDDFYFRFVFHDVPASGKGSPYLNEFWSYIHSQMYEFNSPPYKWDFFLKLKKDGKIYQNWWNGNLVSLPVDISRDETGLKFENYTFSKFEEFGSICMFDYHVLRLEGNIHGVLITKDRRDTINVKGNLDVFLNFSP